MSLISIILPCYNASKYLEPALKSLLAQSFSDFEIIAIDDGSTDDTLELLLEYQKLDPRIKVLQNVENIGISASLNKGIAVAKGRYIARMDADDVTLPKRLASQIDFLERHSEFDVVGASAHLIKACGKILFPNQFIGTSPYALKFISFFTAPVLHSAILGKKDVFLENSYSTNSQHNYIEDQELWFRLLHRGVQISNLKEVHLYYRQHGQSVSKRDTSSQQKDNGQAFLIRKLQQHFGISITPVQADQLRHTRAGDLAETKDLFDQILRAYRQEVDCSPLALQEINQFIELSLCELSLKNLRASTSLADVIFIGKRLLSLGIGAQYYGKRLRAFVRNRLY